MSNEYINGVITHSQSKRSARAVLMALANRAGNDGGVHLSHAAIADEAGVTERTVTRAVESLIASGELRRIDAERRHSSPIYQIALPPEKSAKRRQNDVMHRQPVYANGEIKGRQNDVSLDNVTSSLDNVTSSLDNVTEDYYTRDLNPIEPNRTQTTAAAALPVSADVGFCPALPGRDTETHSDLPPRYDRPIAVAEFERVTGRFPSQDESRELKLLPESATEAQMLQAFEGLRSALKAGTRIRYPVGYVRKILNDILSDAAPPSAVPAFGLQHYNRRNGANHASSSHVLAKPEPTLTPDEIAEFKTLNRRNNAEAAQRRL